MQTNYTLPVRKNIIINITMLSQFTNVEPTSAIKRKVQRKRP